MNRRTLFKAGAWYVPVIAAAVATPLAAASGPMPVACVRVTPNHGHGGTPGNKGWWQGVYSDGTTTELMDNGTAMRDKTWGPLCRKADK